MIRAEKGQQFPDREYLKTVGTLTQDEFGTDIWVSKEDMEDCKNWSSCSEEGRKEIFKDMQSDEWDSDWASPPGDTIKNIMDENGFTNEEVAYYMKISIQEFEDLLSGKLLITDDIADKICIVFSAPKKFWLKRESQYREDLKRINKT